MTRPKLLTAAQVEERIGKKTSTLYAWRSRKRRDVPQPIRVGGRSLAWIESEVDEWIDRQIKERDDWLAGDAEDRPGRAA